MKTIIEQIKTLDKKHWDYYSEIGKRNLQNPLTGPPQYEEFIRRYFETAGKLNILNEIGMQVRDLYRPYHTCSIFFLGILIYYRTDLCKQVIKGRSKIGYKSFPFIWFLTSLYHDFGVAYERNAKANNRLLNIEELKERFHIEFSLLDKKIEGICVPLFKLCKDYYKYRQKEMQSIDHGILAGLVLFDRLVKNRRTRAQQRDDNLFWGEELEMEYAQAAAAVATHNIWLPQEPLARILYVKYRLDYLLNFPPVTSTQFPLLYILGIVDTIDPVKIFTDDNPKLDVKEILNSILISFKPKGIYFKNAPNSKLDFSLFTKKAISLKDWLAVEIIVTKNTLRITMLERYRLFRNSHR